MKISHMNPKTLIHFPRWYETLDHFKTHGISAQYVKLFNKLPKVEDIDSYIDDAEAGGMIHLASDCPDLGCLSRNEYEKLLVAMEQWKISCTCDRCMPNL